MRRHADLVAPGIKAIYGYGWTDWRSAYGGPVCGVIGDGVILKSGVGSCAIGYASDGPIEATHMSDDNQTTFVEPAKPTLAEAIKAKYRINRRTGAIERIP